MTITSSAGSESANLELGTGRGTVVWVPSAAGDARVRVDVEGLDGTCVADSTAFPVLSPPPTIRLTRAPTRAVVGRPVRVSFEADARARCVGQGLDTQPASCSRGAT